MEANTYIIGRARGKETSRLFFGKVETVSKGIVYGTIEKNAHIKTLRAGFEVPVRDVLTVLGKEPHPGKVYGQDVGLRFTGRKTHDFFGPICFFYKPEKAVGEKLWAAFDEAARLLEKAKLPQPDNAVWEIISAEIKAKWAGYYKHSNNPEKNPHRFSIRPESVPVTVGDMVYVILHEYAHYLHAHHATGSKLNARWVRLFNTSVKKQTIERQLSERLLRDLVNGAERPSDYRGQLEEEDRNAFNWILRSIKESRAVSLKELDLLFEAEYKEDIERLWPKVDLHKKDLKPVVSEYATVNYKELFAEAFAFHFTKRKLPEVVTKLVENTLAYAKANS
jgi:hypothetical protein